MSDDSRGSLRLEASKAVVLPDRLDGHLVEKRRLGGGFSDLSEYHTRLT